MSKFFSRISTTKHQYILEVIFYELFINLVSDKFFASILLERGNHKAELNYKAKITDHVADFKKQSLQIPVTLYLDVQAKQFQSKIAKAYVKIIAQSINKQAGYIEIDVASFPNNRKAQEFFTTVIKDSPSKGAKISYEVRVYQKNQKIQFKQLQLKSLAPQEYESTSSGKQVFDYTDYESKSQHKKDQVSNNDESKEEEYSINSKQKHKQQQQQQQQQIMSENRIDQEKSINKAMQKQNMNQSIQSLNMKFAEQQNNRDDQSSQKKPVVKVVQQKQEFDNKSNQSLNFDNVSQISNKINKGEKEYDKLSVQNSINGHNLQFNKNLSIHNNNNNNNNNKVNNISINSNNSNYPDNQNNAKQNPTKNHENNFNTNNLNNSIDNQKFLYPHQVINNNNSISNNINNNKNNQIISNGSTQKPDNPQNDSNMDSILNDLSEEDKNSEIIQLKENNTKLLQENQQLKEKLNVYMKNSNNDLEVYYQLELSKFQRKITQLEQEILKLQNNAKEGNDQHNFSQLLMPNQSQATQNQSNQGSQNTCPSNNSKTILIPENQPQLVQDLQKKIWDREDRLFKVDKQLQIYKNLVTQMKKEKEQQQNQLLYQDSDNSNDSESEQKARVKELQTQVIKLKEKLLKYEHLEKSNQLDKDSIIRQLKLEILKLQKNQQDFENKFSQSNEAYETQIQAKQDDIDNYKIRNNQLDQIITEIKVREEQYKYEIDHLKVENKKLITQLEELKLYTKKIETDLVTARGDLGRIMVAAMQTGQSFIADYFENCLSLEQDNIQQNVQQEVHQDLLSNQNQLKEKEQI